MRKGKRKLSAAVLYGIVVLLVLFGVIADFIGYRQFTVTLTEQYEETALAIAREAAGKVPADAAERFLKEGKDAAGYAELEKELQGLCDRMNTEFIYLFRADREDYGQIEFAFEVVNAESKFDPYPIGHVQPTTNEDYRSKYRKLYEGGTDYAIVVRDGGAVETGSHITVLLPIRNDDGETGALLAVQRQMDALGSARRRYLNSIVIATIVLIAAAGTGWFFFLRNRLLRPIREISGEANRFAADNTLAEKSLADRITYHDELGELALTIDEMERKTLDYFSSLNRITVEKQRVDAELNLAAAIQAGMLTKAFPQREDFTLCASMDPAKEVGGDFYDFFLLDEKRLAFVIADVSGKGVPAALIMAITKVLIKNHVQMGQTPEKAFYEVNNFLCEGNEAGVFVTAWMGVLDLPTGKLTYVNAGHNPPLLRQKNGAFTYLRSRPALVLGGMEETEYRENELTMEHGDRLFLYTDGVTEAADPQNGLYGEERLSVYLNAHPEEDLTETLTGLRRDIDAFSDGASQFDDITMLYLEYGKKEPGSPV